MCSSLPAALVTNCQDLVAGLAFPGPDDRHVLAAPICLETQVLVLASGSGEMPAVRVTVRSVRYRQRVGLVVIGAVLVLVAVVTGLRPHLVAGAGQAAPIPGPPVVGDCVLDPVFGPPMGTIVTATSGGAVPVYPAQQIRPCGGARYGEIAALIAAPKPTVVKGDGDNRYVDDRTERVASRPPRSTWV